MRRIDPRAIIAGLAVAILVGAIVLQVAVRVGAPGPSTLVADAGLTSATVAIIVALVASVIVALGAAYTSRAERSERERGWIQERTTDYLRVAERIVQGACWVSFGGDDELPDMDVMAALGGALTITARDPAVARIASEIYEIVGRVVLTARAAHQAGGGGPDPVMLAALAEWKDARDEMLRALRVELGNEPLP